MRKHGINRIAAMILAAAVILSSISCVTFAVGEQTKGTLINVVYDDSGSMVRENKQNITRWSQAKYAMEVFCAMMGENDIMNIFPMSKEGGLGLTVYGSDPNRVAQIHAMNYDYINTPFATVTAAAKNLKNADDSYEKWLVIITDGAFDDGATPASKVQSKLNECNEDGIKTVYLAIGDSASVMQSNPAMGAYAEKAADGSQVLNKVTSIANQIFEHLVVPEKLMNISGGVTSMTIDIPTNQIVVFAQGDSVSVGPLTLNGRQIQASAVENVKYSDVKPPNYPGATVDTSLKGVVVTFEAGAEPFESGEFSISVSGANTVEYYYSPGVVVNCELLYNGKTVQASDKLYAGDYQIEMNFINPLTNEIVKSELLSAAEFTLKANNNDQEHVVSAESGSVSLAEGDVTISATAELPGNVALTSIRNYIVLPEPMELDLEFTYTKESYSPDEFGQNATPVVIKATDAETGAPISEGEWKATQVSVTDSGGVSWNVQPGSEPGTWNLIPVSTDGTMSNIKAGTTEFNVEISFDYERQYAFGSADFSVEIEEYAGNELKIEIEKPAQSYDLNDMEKAQPALVTVYAEDPQTGKFQPLTEELWNAMELKTDSEQRMGLILEKGEAVGTWYVTPQYYAGDPLMTDSGSVSISVSGEVTSGELTYRGTGKQTIEVEPLSDLNWLKLVGPRVAAIAFLIWLIIGYTIKKKRLKTRGLNPRCKFKDNISPKRRISKDFFSVILPYVPERATVMCYKTAFQCNFPNLRIEATGRRSFKIINKSLPLKNTKICGEFYSDMETLRKRQFSFGSFDITSTNPQMNNRSLGTFTFK